MWFLGTEVRDTEVGDTNICMDVKCKVTRQKDSYVKRVSAPGQPGPSDQVNQLTSPGEEHPSGGLQSLILKELQKVNSRLE